MATWKFTLTDGDFSWNTKRSLDRECRFFTGGKARLHIGADGKITVLNGYAWDGCSPKLRIGDWFYIGVPDGTNAPHRNLPKCFYPSLVHDALYQFLDDPEMPFSRRDADRIFLEMMVMEKFGPRYVYWAVVRVVGGGYRRFVRWWRSWPRTFRLIFDR